MPSNYTGNSTAAQSPASAPAWLQALLLALPIDADSWTSALLYQAFKTLADNNTFLLQHAQQAETDYGDGSDGALVAGFGTLTLTRDAQYSAISMGATDIINTAGFMLRVQGLFTGVSGASVLCDGNITTPGGYNGSTGSGGLGGAPGTTGVAAAAIVSALGGAGGLGGGAGGSGSGSGPNGGAGGTVTAPTSTAWKIPPWVFMGMYAKLTNGVLSFLSLFGGSGGGGGNNNGGVAGQGGGGGGVVFLVARQVSGAFTLRARGGAGQAGVSSLGAGGGGGGGGAAVLVRHQNLSAAITVDVAGGAGGLPNGSGGTGAAGSAGLSTLIEIAA